MAAKDDAISTIDELSKLGDAYKQGKDGAREGLMSSCSKLLSQLMLPIESLLTLQWARPTHQAVVRLGLDIHLFEALASENGSPKTSREIAEATDPKADADLVSRLLRHLAALGTVKETDVDTFAPTPFSISLMDERYRDTVYFIADHWQPVLQDMPAYFATSNYTAPPSGVDGIYQHTFDCKGLHLFEHFQQVPQRGKEFASMMAAWSEGRPKWFADEYYPIKEQLLEGAKQDAEAFLVDIGGGSGHDLEQLHGAYGSEIHGKLVLQDRPEIVELAKVSSDITRMGHDFMTEQPVKSNQRFQTWAFEDGTRLTQTYRRKSLLSPLDHPRLERRREHADSQSHHSCNGEGLLQDTHQ